MSSRTRPPAWETENDEQEYYDDEPVRTRGRRPPPRRPMRKVALPIVGLAAAGGLLVGFLANSGGGGAVTETVTATRTVTAPPAADTPSGAASRATIALAVLNGSGEAGLAGTTAEQARSLGYEDVTEGNAPSAAQADRVLYRQGAEAQAQQVATDLSLPNPLPAAGDAAAAVEPGADVIVVLGPS